MARPQQGKRDNEADRELGLYWSQQFANIMIARGNEVRQFDKEEKYVLKLPREDLIILADALAVSNSTGQVWHCEVKHKEPTFWGSYFGLEQYRFESYQRLQKLTHSKVLYVIHNHRLNGGKYNPDNNPKHWFYIKLDGLTGTIAKTRPSPTYLNGRIAKVPTHYWKASLWHPLPPA